MPQFQLFDAIKLTHSVVLDDGSLAPIETPGAVVEVLDEGNGYLVELFGGWVRRDALGSTVRALPEEKGAFQQTLDVVMLTAAEMALVLPAMQSVGPQTQLLSIVEELPQEVVAEIVNFAQFLRHKQRAQSEQAPA